MKLSAKTHRKIVYYAFAVIGAGSIGWVLGFGLGALLVGF